MNTPAIVTIGYNRPDSLKRLLGSIAAASYPEGVSVPLVISIDKSETDEVIGVAEDFSWEYGEKIILKRNPRMGLRNHVLACGDLTHEYGSIIVLEDDLYVSPAFYDYAVKALDFTEGDERVGSISLYNHLFNVHVRRSFAAVDDGYDNWYLQLASSWGQAYSRKQWDAFKIWYDNHLKADLARTNVPANVSGWSDKSWLKYYIAYLIDMDRFTFYPRISYTTNFGDVGSHAVKSDCDLQVPLSGAKGRQHLSFSRLEDSTAVYDSFFENTRLGESVIKQLITEESTVAGSAVALNVAEGSNLRNEACRIITDLYGYKPVEAMLKEDKDIRYVLSSKALPYKIVKSYARAMRPIDENIRCDIPGNDFYLYDVKSGAEPVKRADAALSYLYEYRGISAKQMLSMIRYRILEKLGRS